MATPIRKCITLGISGNVPTRGSDSAAGYDLQSNADILFIKGSSFLVPTGTKIAMPDYLYGQVSLRSSMGVSGFLMMNGVGIIDPDYRGEIKLMLRYFGDGAVRIKHGDRIAQIVFMPRLNDIEWSEALFINDTARGEGGFGSTGT